MKQQGLYLLAVLGILAACNRELAPEAMDNTNDSNAATVTVLAGMAGTRTAIHETGGDGDDHGFQFEWKKGDQIGLVEGCRAFSEDACMTYPSEPLSGDANDATFTVQLGDREGLSGQLTYMAVYPYYNGWSVPWGYYNDDGQFFLQMEFPIIQYPTADCFDPDADLLVSKSVSSNRRLRDSDQLTFQFARVGTIVKMTLNGLEKGTKIKDGVLYLGFDATYSMDYYPDEMRLKHNDGQERVEFYFTGKEGENPDGITVDGTRQVTVWLRCKSGETDQLILRVNNTGVDSWRFRRKISLRPQGKTLTFKEGGLTSFYVNLEDPDVENPDPQSIDYWTNAARDGVTVSWPDPDDEDLDGYEGLLIGEDRTRYYFDRILYNEDDDRWEATIDQGLSPGHYTLYLRARAVDGKVSQMDYMDLGEDNEDERLAIGVPIAQEISKTTAYWNPAWFTPEETYGRSLDFNYVDFTHVEPFHHVTYGHRNMLWYEERSYFDGLPGDTMGWGIWNLSPVHLTKISVFPYDGDTDPFQVYASDDPFVDGAVPNGDTSLDYTEMVEEGYYGNTVYKQFALQGKSYFLMTGTETLSISKIVLEYYK